MEQLKRGKSLFSDKRKINLVRIVTLVFVFVSPSIGGIFSKSDRGRTGPTVLKMESGVRAFSLGGAFVGSADDASALFWNPAGLQRVPQQEFLAGHSRVFEDQTRDDLGWVLPVWRRGERETWGVQASYLAVDRFELVKNGTPAGTARPWEGVLGLSYARPFHNIFWGVTGKLARKEFPGASGQSYLLDAGLQGTSKKTGIDWGLVLANVGTTMTLGEGSLAPPLVIRWGASKGFLLGPKNRLCWSGQIDAPADDALLGRMGLDYVIPGKEWEFAFRLGGQTAGATRITGGVGIGRGPIVVNYAYGPSENLGAVHRMDVGFRFGKPLNLEVKRRALLETAQSAWDKGQTARAADLLEEIDEFSPRYYPAEALEKEVNRRMEESLKPDTLFNLGRQAYEENDFEAAGNYLRKLVILDPSYPEAGGLLKKAESTLSKEKEARAKEELAHGLARQRRVLSRTAQKEQERGRWSEALKIWRKILVRYPKDAEALAGVTLCRGEMAALAESAEKAGAIEMAVSHYRALHEDRPDPVLSKRIEKLMREETRKAETRARALYQEGVRAYDAGDLKKALPLFEEAVRLNPKDAAASRARDRVRTETTRGIDEKKPR